MVSRQELLALRKLKILLKGPSGSGKTRAGATCAGFVAYKGYKVLYMDGEKGAMDELLTFDDNIINNIIVKPFTNFKNLVETMYKVREAEGDKLRLLVIDPLHLIDLTRISAVDAYLEQGYYYMGEKAVPIENKETFGLRGYLYSLPNMWTVKFLDEIANFDQDIICTIMTPPNPKDRDFKKNDAFDGKFNTILETKYLWEGKIIHYRATPKKMRGVPLSGMPEIIDPDKYLLEKFKERYNISEKVAEKIEDTVAKK